MSMDVWANVVILLMYGYHDMRHTGFPQVESQWDPRDLGLHNIYIYIYIKCLGKKHKTNIDIVVCFLRLLNSLILYVLFNLSLLFIPR